jgi:23S rRNA (cytidine1920-2'-O)/16S rRNA (cytidine1409-2'-O)-methyltransferase
VRGLAETRSRAQALLLAGRVEVEGIGPGGQARAGDLVDAGVGLSLVPAPVYVSRGGDKLAGALDTFLPADPAVDPAGRVCLDVGASTGGFTDVLLRRGATRVYALDVGRGQLAQALRADPRVVVRERLNARSISATTFPERVTLATVDVSFISLEKVLGPIASTFDPGVGGRIVALVKPQFEAGRNEARRGVVRDRDVHRRVLDQVREHAAGIGLRVRDEVESSLVGPAGNREFFLDLEVPGGGLPVGGVPVR